jgi:hypothetical protein
MRHNTGSYVMDMLFRMAFGNGLFAVNAGTFRKRRRAPAGGRSYPYSSTRQNTREARPNRFGQGVKYGRV